MRLRKRKYRCPECAVQVWGKPDLDIRCGADNAQLKDITDRGGTARG